MTEEANVQEQQENTQPEATQEAVEAPKTFTEAEVQGLIKNALDSEVGGLKAKNEELLGKLKEQKDLAKEESIKRNGTYEEMKEHYETKYNTLKGEYEKKYQGMKNAVKERDKAEIIGKLAGSFVDSEAGSFMLKSMIDVEDGNAVYRDFGGNVVADNITDFKQWMSTNPHMAHFVQGTKATGGGASGGAGKAGEAATLTRAEYQEMNQAKRDAYFEKHGSFNFSD